jgi:hypothetical protein
LRSSSNCALENALGVRYDVGRAPVRLLGPPRGARVGLRLRLGGTREDRLSAGGS